MVTQWPRQQAQTKAAIKKARPLEEKILPDVRKKVAETEKMLKPALEHSNISSSTAKDAEQKAHAVVKVWILVFPTITLNKWDYKWCMLIGELLICGIDKNFAVSQSFFVWYTKQNS